MIILLAGGALAAEEDGFVPPFNGHDVSGWVNVNCAPETWSVEDRMIHCTGLPTGALHTTRQYENLRLETGAPPALRELGLVDNGGPAEYMNLYVRELSGGSERPSGR